MYLPVASGCGFKHGEMAPAAVPPSCRARATRFPRALLGARPHVGMAYHGIMGSATVEIHGLLSRYPVPGSVFEIYHVLTSRNIKKRHFWDASLFETKQTVLFKCFKVPQPHLFDMCREGPPSEQKNGGMRPVRLPSQGLHVQNIKSWVVALMALLRLACGFSSIIVNILKFK